RSRLPLAHYDPRSSSWRTSQDSWLEEGWGASLEDWPNSGMTRSGTAFRRQPSVPRTSVTGSGSSPIGPNSDGLWPTPTSGDHSTRYAQGGMPLGMAARLDWPTPTASDAKASGAAGYSSPGHHSGTTLTDAVVRWPTP